MTWFLPQEGEIPTLKPTGPDIKPKDFGEGISAAVTQFNIDHNSWSTVDAAKWNARSTLIDEAMPRLKSDEVLDGLKRSGILPARVSKLTDNDIHKNEAVQEEILRMAREAQTADPQAWNGIDLSQDRVDRLTNEPLQKEYEDAQAILDMSPNPGLASFIGGAAAGVADPRTLPLLLLGGGSGSILKIMAREAGINMAMEAMYLPTQYEMADRLNIPDPDVRTQLLMAAAGGAVFGGAVEAGMRGFTYFRSRSKVQSIPGLSTAQSHMAVEAAEDAIVAGRDPFEAAQGAVEALRPPPPPRQPLILTPQQRVPQADSPLVPNQIEERRLDPLPGQKPEPIPDDELISGLESAIEDAKARDRKMAKPLARYLRASKNAAINLQVHPEGAAAAELRARGITAKTMPGLFSRRGKKDFDNLVASEMESEFPGIIDATGTAYGADYLDSQGFLDVLTRDLNGDSSWLRTRKDVLDLERLLNEELNRIDTAAERTASDAFLQGEKSDGGWFVNLPGYQLDNPDWENALARDFEDYLQRQWEGTFFTPDEKAEMLNELRTRGGDAGILVERMAERELDEVALPRREEYDNGIPFWDDDAPAQGAVGQGAGDSGRPEDATVAEGQGAQGAGNARGPLQEQIPGTERVQTGLSQRQQSEIAARQQQSKIGRLDQTRVEDDPGGLFGGAQRDMFSEPAWNEARAVQDQIAADVRDDIAKSGDVKLELETVDGAKLRSKQAVLDYIDEGDRVSARLDLCGKGPA